MRSSTGRTGIGSTRGPGSKLAGGKGPGSKGPGMAPGGKGLGSKGPGVKGPGGKGPSGKGPGGKGHGGEGPRHHGHHPGHAGHPGHGNWRGHRGWGANWGWSYGWWPLYAVGFMAGFGYYCWRPGWGWGWWDQMYNSSPYIEIAGERVLDQPWWQIRNNTPYSITVTNENASDEVDLATGQEGNLMYYGTKNFTLTFPDGYQATISPGNNNVVINIDEQGNVVVN